MQPAALTPNETLTSAMTQIISSTPSGLWRAAMNGSEVGLILVMLQRWPVGATSHQAKPGFHHASHMTLEHHAKVDILALHGTHSRSMSPQALARAT